MTYDFKSVCTRKRIPMSHFPLLNEFSVAFSSPLYDILPLYCFHPTTFIWYFFLPRETVIAVLSFLW